MKKLILTSSLLFCCSVLLAQTKSESKFDTINIDIDRKNLKVTKLKVEMEPESTAIICGYVIFQTKINDPFGQRMPFSGRELEPMIRTLR